MFLMSLDSGNGQHINRYINEWRKSCTVHPQTSASESKSDFLIRTESDSRCVRNMDETGSRSYFSWTEVSWRSCQTGQNTRSKDILIGLTSTPAWRWPYIHHAWHTCVYSEHSASGAQCLLSYSNSDHFAIKNQFWDRRGHLHDTVYKARQVYIYI